MCGQVRYRVTGRLRDVSYCHCSQCRRTSGHFVAATNCAKSDLHMQQDSGLNWYESSEFARRGFCATCGSSLFWERLTSDNISIMAGTLDTPTGVKAVEHIFVDDASDYYDLCDDLPKFGQYPDNV